MNSIIDKANASICTLVSVVGIKYEIRVANPTYAGGNGRGGIMIIKHDNGDVLFEAIGAPPYFNSFFNEDHKNYGLRGAARNSAINRIAEGIVRDALNEKKIGSSFLY